jgi:hypothetical protein
VRSFEIFESLLKFWTTEESKLNEPETEWYLPVGEVKNPDKTTKCRLVLVMQQQKWTDFTQ